MSDDELVEYISNHDGQQVEWDAHTIAGFGFTVRQLKVLVRQGRLQGGTKRLSPWAGPVPRFDAPDDPLYRDNRYGPRESLDPTTTYYLRIPDGKVHGWGTGQPGDDR